MSVTFNLTDIYGTTAAATASLSFPGPPVSAPPPSEPAVAVAPPEPILPPLEQPVAS
jgi:hypothetical protein